MSAVLHVRCPIIGCGATIDSVIETETWGSSIPGDSGCGNVTLHGTAMTDHYRNKHTGEEQLRTLAKHYEDQIRWSTEALAGLRERFPEVVS